jgi:hypothetical protein
LQRQGLAIKQSYFLFEIGFRPAILIEHTIDTIYDSLLGQTSQQAQKNTKERKEKLMLKGSDQRK